MPTRDGKTTSQDKVRLVLRHLEQGEGLGELCAALGLNPAAVASRLTHFLEHGSTECATETAGDPRSYEKRIALLEEEVRRKQALVDDLEAQVESLVAADFAPEGAGKKRGLSEQRYEQIFRSLPVAIVEEDYSALKELIDALSQQGVTDIGAYIDEDPEFVAKAARMIKVSNLNGEALRMFHAADEEELLGSPARVLPPWSVEAFREELKAIAEGRPVFETEGVIETLDGVKKNILLRMAIPQEPDQFGRLLLTLFDITEHRRAQAALSESEERFRLIFETARVNIFIKDRDLRYTHVNPAMEKTLMRPASDLIGLRSEDVYNEEDAKHIRAVDLRVLSGESLEEEHTRLINRVPVTFLDFRQPLRNAKGDTVGVLGVSRNVTERTQANRYPAPSIENYPSLAMQSTLAKARYAAAADSVILLLGESGSGKDHLARYIHLNSSRRRGPFFSINCAALSNDLAESELFGHEAGAFTGARSRKRGLLELAEGGTLLLNEIGELPLMQQTKLLAFLDTKSFMRVGGEKTISIDARLIAATHRDLKEEVRKGRFMEALFYRLDVFSIRLPPLRERLEDIPILASEISSKLTAENFLPNCRPPSPEMLREFMDYQWPGNVRELRNAIERSMILPEEYGSDTRILEMGTSLPIGSHKLPTLPEKGLKEVQDQVTSSLCEEALRMARGNKKAAARLLGISRYSFYRLLKTHRIECDRVTRSRGKCADLTQDP